MSDEEIKSLILRVRDRDEKAFEELSAQYEPLVQSVISGFEKTTVLGEAEKDDLLQVASIALYDAATSFDVGQTGVTFGLSAKICLNRRLIDTKRRMELEKRRAGKRMKNEAAEKAAVRPGEPFSGAESSRLLSLAKEHLSAFEYAVLKLRASGCRYNEIAESLGCSVKSVDNAIVRARSKLRRLTGRR